jgi:hypothetical protein
MTSIWGYDAKSGEPFTNSDSERMQTHCIITGGSGSGKTVQLEWLVSQWNKNTDAALVVFDLGLSSPLYGVWDQTSRHRKAMRFFSKRELDGAHMDPLALPEGTTDPLTFASHLCENSNITSDLDYGVFFFYMAAFSATLAADLDRQKRGLPRNMNTLLDAFERQGREFRDAELIRYVVAMLAQYGQLSTAGVPEENVLDWSRVLEERQSVYIGAPVMGGGSAARQIASLALGCLLMEAMARCVARKPIVPVTVVIDEAHFIVSAATDTFLNTARKFGISCVLTAQHSGQFVSGNRDVLTTLRMSCGMKIFFTASPEEREYISGESLDRLVRYRRGQDENLGVLAKHSWAETREPSFSENRVRIISGTKRHAVLMWDTDGKFSNPHHIIVPYFSKTLAEHQALEAYPFPIRPVPLPVPVLESSGGPHLAPLSHPDALVRQKGLEALQQTLLARIKG